MPLPIVAIVGRPNVGKSSLLNAFAGRRISIVDPTAGVTRDRVSAICEHHDRWFELVDTGGYGVEDVDNLTAEIERQIGLAVDSAQIILFMVDVREEITPLDRDVARFLKKHRERTILVANKADAELHEGAAGTFIKLGFGEPHAISALHGRGTRILLDEIVDRLPPERRPAEASMKLAIIGRRNVGKSTFVNAVAGQPRVIVSEIAGTTRDSIDVRFEKDGKTFVIIDTAGVRKFRKIAGDIEFYASVRANAAIRRADVVLLLFDATAKVSEVDKKIAAFAVENVKPVILVINKWDLAKGKADSEDYSEYLNKTLPALRFAPVAFCTATQDRNVDSVIDLAMSLFKQANTRVETGRLNKALEQVIEEHPPPSAGRYPPKIYYASQVAVAPPTIVLFCNRAAAEKNDYRRYMEKRLAELLPYSEVPIRLIWRQRESSKTAVAQQRNSVEEKQDAKRPPRRVTPKRGVRS